MTKSNDKKTEIVIRDKEIGEFLKSYENLIVKFAVRNYKHSDFMKTAMLCISESASLQKCLLTEKGKNSLYHALKLGATTGLSLNPQEGKACLVAYQNKKSGEMVVNYQIMKNGMLQLLDETGKVKYITAEAVRENDEFVINKSMDGDTYNFRPALTGRGNCIGYFAACRLTDDMTYVVYMSEEEMIDHYKTYAVSKKEGMTTYGEGMAKKTVLKRLVRSLHLSSALDAGIGADDTTNEDETREPIRVDAKVVDTTEKPTDVI
jgi:recombination protein RecT